MLKTDTFAESGNPCGSLAIAPEPSGSDGPAISVRFWRVPVFACDKHFSSPVPSLRPACAVPLYLMMIASPLFVGSPLANDKRRRRGLKLDPVSHAPSPALELTGQNKSFFHFRSQVEDLSAERGSLSDRFSGYAPDLERRLLSRLKPTKDRWRVDDGGGSKSSHRPIGSICVLPILQRRSIISV